MKSVLICVVMVLALAANAQRNGNIPAKSAMHHEVMEQPYVQDDLSKHPRSKAYTYKGVEILTTQVNVYANGMYILGDAANEPTLVILP